MSKSLGNAMYLSDPIDVIKQKIQRMYTDPHHIKITDPGTVEGNTVFAYLDAFDPDKNEVARLKEQYQRGGLGDMVLKKRLLEVLEALLRPIQERRKELEKDPFSVMKIVRDGTEKAQETAEKTLYEVKTAMYLHYFE